MAGEATWDSFQQLLWKLKLTHCVVIRSGNNLPGPSTRTHMGMHCRALRAAHRRLRPSRCLSPNTKVLKTEERHGRETTVLAKSQCGTVGSGEVHGPFCEVKIAPTQDVFQEQTWIQAPWSPDAWVAGWGWGASCCINRDAKMSEGMKDMEGCLWVTI